MFSLAKVKGHKIIFLIWLHENSKYFAQISLHFSPTTQAFRFLPCIKYIYLSCAICSGVFQEMLTLHLQ